MADVLEIIASIEWVVLGVIVFLRLKWWDKVFSEINDGVKDVLEENDV